VLLDAAADGFAKDRSHVSPRHLVAEHHGEALEILLQIPVDGDPERPATLGDGVHLGGCIAALRLRCHGRAFDPRERSGAKGVFPLFSLAGRGPG